MGRFSSTAVGVMLAMALSNLNFVSPQTTKDVVKTTTVVKDTPNGQIEKVKTTTFQVVNVGTGGGSGDPLIRAADGTLFFFDGEPGKFYNLISEPGAYQVSTLLKEANNAVHQQKEKNGTYMQAVGFKQGNARIEVKTFAHDSARMVVKVNDELMYLQNPWSQKEQQTIPLDLGGEVNVTFTLYHEHDGTVAYISSPHITVRLSLVPPGLDHAGYWQPSYVNVNITIINPPEQPLQGVIGDTFHALDANKGSNTAATAARPAASGLPIATTSPIYPVYPDSAYELVSLFDDPPRTFGAEFTHAVIMQHKQAAAHAHRLVMAA